MYKIFVLKETSNRGKSSTIKMIFFLLMQKYHKTSKIDSFSVNTRNYDDITAQIIIDGKRIGIESEGDPDSKSNPHLKQSLDDFDKANCNIIFCPTRKSGMTEDWINSHSPKYKIEFYQQNTVKADIRKWKRKQSESNFEVAEQLIKAAGL